MIDPTITLGNIIEISSIIGGGLLALIRINNNVVKLNTDVKGMQDEIKKIGDVLIVQTDQNRRIINLEDDVRELRHGDGYVLPRKQPHP